MKITISKSQWEEMGKKAGLAEMWGKTESTLVPKPIRDMIAQKLRDVPDEQLDGAMDGLLDKLHMPRSEFVKAALKKFIAEIRRKDNGENILPNQPKQIEQPARLQLNPAKPMPQLEQIQTSSKKTIKISKSQWEGMGKKAGWMKVAMNWNEWINIGGEKKYFDRHRAETSILRDHSVPLPYPPDENYEQWKEMGMANKFFDRLLQQQMETKYRR